MKIVRSARVAVLLLWLSGCQTPYQEMGFDGGVSAAPIGNDMYRISARGNGYTDSTVVQDYVLLKAAETAIQAGHSHFIVLSEKDVSRQSVGQTQGFMQTSFIGNTAYSTYTPGITYDIYKPGQDLIIQTGNISGGNALGAMEAAQVYNAINPRVARPKKR